MNDDLFAQDERGWRNLCTDDTWTRFMSKAECEALAASFNIPYKEVAVEFRIVRVSHA